MEKYYVFGHTNPDTDSVCAAITLANLKRKLGYNAEERVLGDINKETKFVLKYFKVKEPRYLNDIKIRIKDLNYRKNCYMTTDKSIEDVYLYMQKHNTTGVPIVDKNKKFISLITAKDILKKSFLTDDTSLETSYDNLLKTLKGQEVVRINEEINGVVHAIAFAHETFEHNINLGPNDIVIVGDRHHIINYAIESKVSLIIIVGNKEITKEHIKLAKKNKVNIIKTPLNTFETSRIILFSNYIKKIINEESMYILHERDYYDDFMSLTNHLQIDNFPVINIDGKCMGLLRKSELSYINKRKVILVDHNEIDQSALGLEEADITEIVDHHKLGALSTNTPINFRNMIVGSTNTIIYLMYRENGVKITKPMAGLMLSGLLSDTLMFKSPTTTDIDIKVAKDLNKICKLNIENFSIAMFKAGTSLEGLTIEDVLGTDSKTFENDDIKFTISQKFTMNYEDILKEKDTYLNKIEEIKKYSKVDHYIFAITDIINDGSYLLYDSNSEELIKKAFKLKKCHEGVFIEKCVSRKKQIVPSILDVIE